VVVHRAYAFDATTLPNQNIHEQSPYLIGGGYVDSNQTAIGKVSLTINPQGTELQAAWSSRSSTFPNSFNIRYAKGTINGDGSVTWGAVTQVTAVNLAGGNNLNPTIVIRQDGNPVIMYDYNSGSAYNAILSQSFNGTSWSSAVNVFRLNSYTQSSPSAVVDKDGVIHVAWYGIDATDTSTHHIRYSSSPDGGVTWTAMQKLTSGITFVFANPTITVDTLNTIFILFVNTNSNLGINYVKKISGSAWSNRTQIRTPASGTYVDKGPSALFDPNFGGTFGDLPPAIYMNTQEKAVKYVGAYSTNTAPTVTLTSPNNNQTLYENDILSITGEAYDANKDQSVTVFYQINSEQRKVLATNLSQTQISLSKQLTFKGSKLFDGEVAITGVLADGVAHTLKVWAVDNEGGQSATIERTFYVVPNRAPILSVETPTPSGIIDADSFTINGLYEDSDGNQTTISYRINGSNAIQVASGVSGPFSFEVKLGSLITGDNIITVEAVDSYGAKTTKSVKLSKSIISAPLLKSTARYKITPPTGTASEILVWVQHDTELTLSASVSMTIAGEQESYAPMTLSNSEILQSGQVEDEFYYAADGAKDSVILRLDLTKSNVNTNEAITLITGVF